MPSDPKTRARNLGLLTLKAVVTVGLLWLIATKTDFSAVTDRMRSASVGAMLLALALLATQVGVNVVRWQMITRLEGPGLQIWTATRIYFEGLFFNQALPSVVGGDALRIYRAQRLGMSVRAAANSVLFDRLIGLTGLLVLALAALPLFFDRASDGRAVAAVALLLAAGVGGVLLVFAIASVPERFARFRVASETRRFCKYATTTLLTPSTTFPVLVLGIIGHLCVVGSGLVLAHGVGFAVTPIDCLIVIPTAMLISMAPISIAGWGLREGAMTTGFALIGLQADGALAVSILIGLLLLVIGLFGGAIWLLSGGKSPAAASQALADSKSDTKLTDGHGG